MGQLLNTKTVPEVRLVCLRPDTLEQVKNRTGCVLVPDSVEEVGKGGAAFALTHSKYPED